MVSECGGGHPPPLTHMYLLCAFVELDFGGWERHTHNPRGGGKEGGKGQINLRQQLQAFVLLSGPPSLDRLVLPSNWRRSLSMLNFDAFSILSHNYKAKKTKTITIQIYIYIFLKHLCNSRTEQSKIQKRGKMLAGGRETDGDVWKGTWHTSASDVAINAV